MPDLEQQVKVVKPDQVVTGAQQRADDEEVQELLDVALDALDFPQG